jgi:hypothetical protein
MRLALGLNIALSSSLGVSHRTPGFKVSNFKLGIFLKRNLSLWMQIFYRDARDVYINNRHHFWNWLLSGWVWTVLLVEYNTCRLLKVNRHINGTYCLLQCWRVSHQHEAGSKHYMSECRTLQSHCCENLTPCVGRCCFVICLLMVLLIAL